MNGLFFTKKLQETTAEVRNTACGLWHAVYGIQRKAKGKCHIRKDPAKSFLQDQRF